MGASVRASLDVPKAKNLSYGEVSGKVLSLSTSDPENVQEMTPNQLASVLLDQALLRAGAKSGWIAATLEVSESTVSKWRSPQYDHSPTWAQIVALGPDVQKGLQKEVAKFHNCGRLALLALIGAVEDLAEAVGE